MSESGLQGGAGLQVSTQLWSELLLRLVGDASAPLFSQNAPPARLRWTAERTERSHAPPHHIWRPASRAVGARERRQMVHACRALRMQIKSFEDDFSTAKGHSPRGAERAPLASTYRQYREWKRDIRDHAASQIQALARRSAASPPSSAAPAGAQAVQPRAASAAAPGNDPALKAPLLSLQQEKRRVKQQLKDYDTEFYRTHGRMPQKAEKEPIRQLYEAYHAIKAKLQEAP
ncbi:hypothetical protein M885DRAFT_521322 [Pelagophyceae sp. CCMP2097]|nr:hypothetical protein M885DRAFT_521322 [Pelagophyceae sp. CCMP2097]|mmetsp:Transcript_6769/g.21841  ORF Transcript_6769/g.21841 Transcript_6769/m.21841 type:complete len:232 (+) Transcript_6769:114-809(+)